MRTRTQQKLNDEIKRLNRLVKKNKADKRNEVRQEKVKVLKELKKLNNKLKSKQLKPRQYSIQYKDLVKKLKSYKTKRVKITKDDLKGPKGFSRDDRYASIFSWKNSLGRGIIGAFARGGKLDNILGFEVADYLDVSGNYQSIMEKIKTSYKEELYDLLDKYFIIGDFTFDEILSIMGQARYAQRLYELFYYDPNDPRFDFDYFEMKLIDFLDQIRKDYNLL